MGVTGSGGVGYAKKRKQGTREERGVGEVEVWERKDEDLVWEVMLK